MHTEERKKRKILDIVLDRPDRMSDWMLDWRFGSVIGRLVGLWMCRWKWICSMGICCGWIGERGREVGRPGGEVDVGEVDGVGLGTWVLGESTEDVVEGHGSCLGTLSLVSVWC